MKYLKTYRMFEFVETPSNTPLLYKEDIIDIFQGIIDLGYKPSFDLRFIDINGKWKDVKTASEETPVLKISFKTNNVAYVGGSIKFDNLDYLENLYHNLSMFMSMYGSKCTITYELDNKVELVVKCKFPTEYDETKVKTLTENQLMSMLNWYTKDFIKNNSDLGSQYDITHNGYFKISIDPKEIVLNNMMEEAKKNVKKDKRFDSIDNWHDLLEIRDRYLEHIATKLSNKLKSNIIYISGDRAADYYGREGGTGFYEDDKKVKILGVDFDWDDINRYINVKSGLLSSRRVRLILESYEITFFIP